MMLFPFCEWCEWRTGIRILGWADMVLSLIGIGVYLAIYLPPSGKTPPDEDATVADPICIRNISEFQFSSLTPAFHAGVILTMSSLIVYFISGFFMILVTHKGIGKFFILSLIGEVIGWSMQLFAVIILTIPGLCTLDNHRGSSNRNGGKYAYGSLLLSAIFMLGYKPFELYALYVCWKYMVAKQKKHRYSRYKYLDADADGSPTEGKSKSTVLVLTGNPKRKYIPPKIKSNTSLDTMDQEAEAAKRRAEVRRKSLYARRKSQANENDPDFIDFAADERTLKKSIVLERRKSHAQPAPTIEDSVTEISEVPTEAESGRQSQGSHHHHHHHGQEGRNSKEERRHSSQDHGKRSSKESRKSRQSHHGGGGRNSREEDGRHHDRRSVAPSSHHHHRRSTK